MNTSLRDFCTTLEAAEILKVTPQHVARECKRGKWKAQKFGSEYVILRSAIDPRPWREHNPDELARYFRAALKLYIGRNGLVLRILGVLASGDTASKVYADYLVDACEEVGITLDLKTLDPADARKAVAKANTDRSIQGIFVFYPIFGDERDAALKASIEPRKDIEGLSPFWMKKLYEDVRYIDTERMKKAILPCTPLAVLKTLEFVGLAPDVDPMQSFKGKRVTIFNRSDLVGKPLAYMLANDGAEVYSFDLAGGVRLRKGQKPATVTRAEALGSSDIVVTGVPSRAFEKVRGEEIQARAICLNFSFVQNFEDSAKIKAGVYVPRVGPMTIAMCLRNMVRLFENYQDEYAPVAKVRRVMATLLSVDAGGGRRARDKWVAAPREKVRA